MAINSAGPQWPRIPLAERRTKSNTSHTLHCFWVVDKAGFYATQELFVNNPECRIGRRFVNDAAYVYLAGTLANHLDIDACECTQSVEHLSGDSNHIPHPAFQQAKG